jgi:hypothetical protein
MSSIETIVPNTTEDDIEIISILDSIDENTNIDNHFENNTNVFVINNSSIVLNNTNNIFHIVDEDANHNNNNNDDDDDDDDVENNNNSIMNKIKTRRSCIKDGLPIENSSDTASKKKRFTSSKKVREPLRSLSYKEYMNNPSILLSASRPELKTIALQYNLKITATKPVLIERITEVFNNTKNVIHIQRIFRGHLIRYSNRLRGPGFNNISLCINDTDGYTMEPLNEIGYYKFYSYTGSNNMVYGFDVLALYKCHNIKGKIMNPYTRERINVSNINDIITLSRIISIVYKNFIDPTELVPRTILISSTQNTVRRNPRQFNRHDATNNNDRHEPVFPIINANNNANNNINANNNANNNINANNNNNNVVRITDHLLTSDPNINIVELRSTITNRLITIREQTIEQRIINSFMEIDSLGNYTQASWFSNLNRRELVRFIYILYELWNIRTTIPLLTRQKICIVTCPFIGINTALINEMYRNHDIINIRERAVCIIEKLIYCGIDVEYCKLGAMLVLTSMTVVSQDARNSLPWLYESVNM